MFFLFVCGVCGASDLSGLSGLVWFTQANEKSQTVAPSGVNPC